LPNYMKYILRFTGYFFTRLVILAVVAGLIVLAFFIAMDYMSVNVLVKDALEKRAEYIIRKTGDQSALIKTFSKSFLAQDTLLYSDTYADYVVRGFNQEVETGFVMVFPWDDTVHLSVTERILTINGELREELTPEGATEEEISPPPWQDGRYIVTLERSEDNWLITDMERIEKIEKPAPSPTQTPVPDET